MSDYFATPWTVARQALLSMGFPRQEHWSGLPCPPPGHLPNPRFEPASPALPGRFFTTEPPGKPDEESLSSSRIQLELLLFPVSYCWVFKNCTHNHQQPETIDFPVRLKIMRALSRCILTNSINMWITYESKEHKINPNCLDHSRPCHRWLGIVPLRALSNSECQSAYCDLSDYGIWSVERFLEEGCFFLLFFFFNLSGKP